MAAIFTLLMIIDNLDVRRPRLLIQPLEANSPLIVDANTILPLSIAGEGLESISRQGGKIPE